MQEPREAQRYPTRFQYSKNAPSYTLSPKFINMLEKSWFSQTFPLAWETNKTETPNSLQSDLQQKKSSWEAGEQGLGHCCWGWTGPVQSLSPLPGCRLSWAGATQTARPCYVLTPTPTLACKQVPTGTKHPQKQLFQPDCPISGKQISAKEGQSMLCPNTDFFYSKDTQVPLSFPLSPAIPGEKYPAKQKRNEVKYALLLISW